MIAALCSRRGAVAHGNVIAVAGRTRACSKLAALRARFDVETGDLNETLTADTALVVLCIKPYQFADVARALRDAPRRLAPSCAVVSVMAGVPLATLRSALAPFDGPLVRAMPSTAASVGASATAWCAAAPLTPSQVGFAAALCACRRR